MIETLKIIITMIFLSWVIVAFTFLSASIVGIILDIILDLFE
jgi:hypothetical protein